MENPTIFEEAGRYFAGELSEEEKKKIDERLEHDKEYAKEFSKFIMMKELLRENKKNEFLSKFNDSDEENVRARKNKGFTRLFIFAIFILLIGFLGYYLWNNNKINFNNTPVQKEIALANYLNNSKKEITAEFLETKKNTSRSVSDKFFKFFKESKFIESLQIATDELEKSDVDNRWIWLERQGMSSWELGDLNITDKIFEILSDDENLLPQYNPAKWYQALIALELENEERAKILLQEIISINEEGEYHQNKNDALELLEILNKLDKLHCNKNFLNYELRMI